MDASMRAGLFGGTFNPIHKGHLMVAEQVVRRFGLDRLYIVPCRVPPHKIPAFLAPAADRVRMIQLALPPDARYRLSDIEIKRSGPSFTIDTVAHFTARVIPGATLFLVMGMDAFLEIHTWKNYQRLLERVQPVVVTRYLENGAINRAETRLMDNYIRDRLSADYDYNHQRARWQRNGTHRIHLLQTTPVAISSSQVRQWVVAGKAIDDLVPQAVKAYIDKKELYL
jgi:nicotinate-nucleotide adenylyltransferase